MFSQPSLEVASMTPPHVLLVRMQRHGPKGLGKRTLLCAQEEEPRGVHAACFDALAKCAFYPVWLCLSLCSPRNASLPFFNFL